MKAFTLRVGLRELLVERQVGSKPRTRVIRNESFAVGLEGEGDEEDLVCLEQVTVQREEPAAHRDERRCLEAEKGVAFGSAERLRIPREERLQRFTTRGGDAFIEVDARPASPGLQRSKQRRFARGPVTCEHPVRACIERDGRRTFERSRDLVVEPRVDRTEHGVDQLGRRGAF